MEKRLASKRRIRVYKNLTVAMRNSWCQTNGAEYATVTVYRSPDGSFERFIQEHNIYCRP